MDASISPKEFLETVFPADLVGPEEMVVVAWPDKFQRDNRTVDFMAQRGWHPRRSLPTGCPLYFCVSTVVEQDTRQVRKRLQDVVNAYVVVLDDVGTKSEEPALVPSYKLETSEGNFQWGYLIDPLSVFPDAYGPGPDGYDRLLYSLAAAGLNDPGCRSPSRLMRLPGALHRTGFTAQITHWEPWRVWDFKELQAEFMVPIVEPRRARARNLPPGEIRNFNDVSDWLLQWLYKTDRIIGHNEDFAFIRCPWVDEHTDGEQGATSTAYSPDNYGSSAPRGFKCLHGHCSDRTLVDLINFAVADQQERLKELMERTL